LDNQGANLESGTGTVFEHYARGYYADDALRSQFWANKIKIPEKERKDTTLQEGIRKQQFDGYYTKKAGEGFHVIKPDGFLNTNINHAGDYKYFTKNSTVYANWKDMSIVQFDQNLSEEDMKLIDLVIELVDGNTGEEERIEEGNMVTNAVNDILGLNPNGIKLRDLKRS